MAKDAYTSSGSDQRWLLIRESELAARWRKSQRTLQRWRAQGRGPAWILIGGAVRYRLADILAYEDEMRRGGAKQ